MVLLSLRSHCSEKEIVCDRSTLPVCEQGVCNCAVGNHVASEQSDGILHVVDQCWMERCSPLFGSSAKGISGVVTFLNYLGNIVGKEYPAVVNGWIVSY